MFQCLVYASSTYGSDKCAAKAIPSVFMGYFSTRKSHRLYDLHIKSFFTCQNVVFHESVFRFLHAHSIGSPLFSVLHLSSVENTPPSLSFPSLPPKQGHGLGSSSISHPPNSSSLPPVNHSSTLLDPTTTPMLRKSTRTRNPPIRMHVFINFKLVST